MIDLLVKLAEALGYTDVLHDEEIGAVTGWKDGMQEIVHFSPFSLMVDHRLTLTWSALSVRVIDSEGSFLSDAMFDRSLDKCAAATTAIFDAVITKLEKEKP